jgi:carboxymethylenebutenolidase
MGGALSLYAATKNSKVGACVVFYGGHPNVKPDLANLQCPVLGIYAERDGSVTPAVVHELEDKLKSLGKSIEVHIYPDVGHAFFNDTRPQVYNAEASANAWQRTVEFLRVNLD